MQINEVIRTYRKAKNMTQEEMASRLGVTAPAVNKWESGATMPDITLLPPIARLLGISLDTLLSFQDELKPEEINALIQEGGRKLKETSYEEMLVWVKEILSTYPNCEMLAWQFAVLLDGRRLTDAAEDGGKYEEYICSLYVRALESREEKIRNAAAGSLFRFYLRKKEYGKAEEYLNRLSQRDPAGKQMQAQLCGERGQNEEACRLYEEILFSCCQYASGVLHGLYLLAGKENDRERAQFLADKQEELARCFEMGRYHEIAARLEAAAEERRAEETLALMKELLSSLDQIRAFAHSPLYCHMNFREISESFQEELREALLKSFRAETYGFLKGNEEWERLVN